MPERRVHGDAHATASQFSSAACSASTLRVDRSLARLTKKDRFDMSRLYVGNLSFTTTQDSLRAAMAGDGRQVKEVSIVMDRETGRPRGFAFVEMQSKADADKAIKALDGTSLDGRQIKVNEAQERQPRTGGGGGGGGGRRDGGGGGGRW